MFRALRLSPLRFLVDSPSKSIPNKNGTRTSNYDNWVGCSCSVTTLTGNELVGHRDESSTMILQRQIVGALCSGERHIASSLLVKLMNENYPLEANDFLHILRYCARSPDPVFVMETYSAMSEREISMDTKSLLFIVIALCNGGYFDQASDLINFAGESGSVSPVLPLYNYVLRACAKTKNLLHASKCLDLMDRQRVGRNETTYSELLKLAVLQRNLSAVQEFWKEYTKHYSLNIFCLRKFIWSFRRLGDLKSAYGALQQMVDLAIRGKHSLESNTKGRLCTSRLDIPIPLCGETGLQEVGFHEHPVATMVDAYGNDAVMCKLPDRHSREVECSSVGLQKVLRSTLLWSFNDVIHACGQAKNSELAEQLMLQMQNLGLQPSSYTYDGFVRAVVSQEGYRKGMAQLKLMQLQNLKPYVSTLATVSAHCSKALRVDLAEFLLDQVSEPCYAYPFNNLLAACDTLDQPERALRVLAKMKQLKVHPDIRTYELLFSLFGNVNAPYEKGNLLSQAECAKRIRAIEMDMARNGFQHSLFSIWNLLKAFGAEGMVREMILYLQRAEFLFSDRDMYLGTSIYNTVLHSLVEAQECNLAIEIFKSMKSRGFPLDSVTYCIMIDCCSYIHSYRSARGLVSMMIRDGFSPETVTFTALMKILLDDGNFEEALNLLDQAASEGINTDVLTYNTILQKACEKGMIGVIEYVVERMHQERVKPDPTTCQFVFTAYVKRGFYMTALEALNIMSLRMLSKEDNESLEDKRTELEEDFILSEDPEAEEKIVQLFKNSEEHLAAMVLNLRWCAILGSQVLWSEDQSSWSRRLSNMYGV
ncbi:PREDICTED: pentatricopeptide repeat-containing protein At1g76280 isoform X2 [Tarenaya hassleriana]|uniref:pentatricopeptide repeat-containing protein At1g76280 isoform X2 n=1 Tax=Tarenaya hassleriana TaxID=28532 RepID=UPI00053C29B3|nr:PREDICTED: pentatricopeptide repeat-containing protein At1g76280 isoform X2 [Tarenaya hassleriana]